MGDENVGTECRKHSRQTPAGETVWEGGEKDAVGNQKREEHGGWGSISFYGRKGWDDWGAYYFLKVAPT